MKLLSVATLLTLSQNNPYPELIPPHTYYSKEYQIIQNYPSKQNFKTMFWYKLRQIERVIPSDLIVYRIITLTLNANAFSSWL